MMAIGAGSLRCYGSPAVHVAWYWIEMGVGVHGEPGAYVMMTLVSLISGGFHRWCELDVVGVLGTDARIGPSGWGGLGLSVLGLVG